MDTAYRSHPLRWLLLGLLLSLLSLFAPLAIGEEPIFRSTTTGATKATVDPRLYECTEPVVDWTDCPEISTAGIDLLEHPTIPGDYLWTGLPDPTGGTDTRYALTFTIGTREGWYLWPLRMQEPAATLSAISFRVGAVSLAGGDTEPVPAVTVAGMTSNPTGATVTFDLWRSSGPLVLDDVSAYVVSAALGSDGKWTATFAHDWTAVETAALAPTSGQRASVYHGRFTVNFAAGSVMSFPASPTVLRVEVYP